MKEVILNNQEIQDICKNLASKLMDKFKDSKKIPIFIGVLKGAMPFFMDLIKYYTLPMKTDFVQVSSYEGTSSTGIIHLKRDISENIKNKDIVIVEDIVDTGLTINYLRQYLEIKYQPSSIAVCVLVDKKPLREVDFTPDYVGLTLNENKFLVGYGFDYKELVRNFDCIFVPTKSDLDEWDKALKVDSKLTEY
jgi:hypoxanthine phosphoribosyltransferase